MHVGFRLLYSVCTLYYSPGLLYCLSQRQDLSLLRSANIQLRVLPWDTKDMEMGQNFAHDIKRSKPEVFQKYHPKRITIVKTSQCLSFFSPGITLRCTVS